MTDPRAELSSVATALEELSARLTAIADHASRTREETLATELYEVERALGGARRRLAKVLEGSGRRTGP